ncbi:MAG: periplasmic binding protein/LacI transcriptional regulator [Firmicutes bacterium]|nr:periplasmic binding protein/LacI transcriptional regulator [Bacillota bacterium]
MKLRKIIIDITVILFAFLLFVIWHQSSFENKALMTISRVKYFEVHLITTDKEYQYWDFINQGAADMAKAVGIKYVWDAPSERNVEKQIEVINKAVETGADALLVAADDPKLISGAIEDAKAKGVKIVYVDSPAYEEAITTLATDNYEAGKLAGETMLSLLTEMGIDHGSIGIVSVKSKANTQLREIGFRDAIANDKRYNIIKTVETERGDAKEAQLASEKMIMENEDLVALFGTNEGTSIGVGNAIKANNNRYIGIGFDQTDAMMELLKEGSIKAIIAQNPYTMGYLGVAEAVAALLGKDTGPDYINTGSFVIRNKEGRGAKWDQEK